MTMNLSLTISERDAVRLRRLIEAGAADPADAENLQRLSSELERAHVVPETELPGDVVALNSTVELEDLEDLIPVTFDKEDYETLNGFLIDKLEHIPGEDETCVVDYDGYRFTVLQIDNNIIQTVKIEKVFEA